MRRFDTYCGGRKSLIPTQNTMRLREIFRRSEVFIEGLFQIDLFLFILNIFKSITKPIVTLVLSHVIIILNDIFSFLAYNFNRL